MVQADILVEPDFLTFERSSDVKHELIRNEIIEMSGASFKHNILCANIIFILSASFQKEENLIVLSNDLRVTNPLNDSYCYPDIVVTDGEPKFIDTEFDTLLNPILIAEILSPSTEKRDQIEKFEIYKSIPTIKEYMIVAQHKPYVKLFKKIATNHWELFEYENFIEKVSILDNKYQISLADIYKRVF